VEMAMQGRYRELYDILPGNSLFRMLRLLKLEWRKRKTANFATSSHNPAFFEAYRRRWPHMVVRDELVTRYGLEERYFAEARFDVGYTDLKKFTLEKRWMPFVPTRMENCTLMAAGRKIEYRWPMLDVRLVRLFLAIPSEENFYRGMGRYLHRRAIDGMVPKLVTWKQSKDMGTFLRPSQEEMSHRLQLDVAALHPILSEYIDLERLQRQVEQFSSLHSNIPDERRGQFTSNIRTTMALNAWLRHMETKEKAP
jgi:asparagine synthase (glutamine-hydrolysing)